MISRWISPPDHPVQRLLYDLKMGGNNHPAAGALFVVITGKIEPILFALYTACSGLEVSSCHPPAFPGAPAGIPRVKAAQSQTGRDLCLSVISLAERLHRDVSAGQFEVSDFVRPLNFFQATNHFPIFARPFKHVGKVQPTQVASPR